MLLNRGEQLTDEEVKNILQVELYAWQENINKFLKQLVEAEALLSLPVLSKEDAKELKNIYKNLAKRLHPDINDCDEKDKLLWVRVCTAYKNGI